MDSAFQIVVMTDRPADQGGPQRRVYAATTDTAQAALALAKAELPPTWQIEVLNDFKFGLAVVRDHALEPNQLVWVS